MVSDAEYAALVRRIENLEQRRARRTEALQTSLFIVENQIVGSQYATTDYVDTGDADTLDTAETYTDSSLGSALAPLVDVEGVALGSQYSFDYDTAAGNLTAHAGSIIGPLPELTWSQYNVVAYYYSTNGSAAWPGGFSTDGTNLYFNLISLSPGLQHIIGTVYIYFLGRP